MSTLDELRNELGAAEDTIAALRAEVAELRQTIAQIADYEDDVYRALARATEVRHAGIRAADKVSP